MFQGFVVATLAGAELSQVEVSGSVVGQAVAGPVQVPFGQLFLTQ